MSKTTSSKPPESYEAALQELETLVTAMEGGQMPLEKSLEAYQRGTLLLKYCQEQLADAQQKVRVLEADSLRELPVNDDVR